MRRIAFVSLAAITLLIHSTSAAPAREPLAVRIVPTRHDETSGRGIELRVPPNHFQVVVTNVSNQNLRLWREWCSWGYFNLSFEATDQNGRTVTVSKREQGWDKNFPDPILVLPGEHLVYEVSFDEDKWKNSPTVGLKGVKTIKMQAIFEIKPDKHALEKEVWTGRVTSPTNSYTLRK